jgi:hypothetical protein
MENNKDETFIMECPVCKKKHELSMMKRGWNTAFACMDGLGTQGSGCESVITIKVAEKGYNEK